MKHKNYYWVALTLVATATFAHEGVQNAAVKARMESMKSIAEQMKTLGTMAQGKSDFDKMLARNAAGAIAKGAANTTELFASLESDPKSQATLSIWEMFDEFSSKAVELEVAAIDASVSIESIDDVKVAMTTLGGICKSCHSAYRQ